MPAKQAKRDSADAVPYTAGQTGQRLDRWLWFARVTKSRSLAASLISDGKVRINKVRVSKPSQTIKVGDVVTLTVHRKVRVLKLLGLGTRRGPATEAQRLYEDLTPPSDDVAIASSAEPAAGQSGGAGDKHVHRPQAPPPTREPGSGRPTKRDRRSLDRLRPDSGE